MKKIVFYTIFIAIIVVIFITPSNSYAQPYGHGNYNDVSYGNATSLSIATSGNVSMSVTPTTDGTLSTGNSTVTVTSTDVDGYKLYIRALSDTNMNNLGSLLPTSGNSSPSSLAINTWGYNIDASNNFTGISLTDQLIRSVSTPTTSGDITNVTYGIKVDMAKPAGKYVANIVYTAVPQTN